MAAISLDSTAAGGMLSEQQTFVSDDDVLTQEKKVRELKDILLASDENLLEKLTKGDDRCILLVLRMLM